MAVRHPAGDDNGVRTKNTFFGLLALAGAVGLASCHAATNAPAAAARVREPAVAGLFYPGDPGELSRAIEGYLAAVKPAALPGRLRALICPHAGYRYSGPVAAHGYRLLEGRSYETVILLAPNHYASLYGASVTAAAVYRTPLGDVPISEKAAQLAAIAPFQPEKPAELTRPSWWPQSSRKPPADGSDTPDTWEHSGEVQVPFLQKTLRDFKLLSVVMGPTDPTAAATALAGLLDDRTLLVVSSDLSHYHPYDEATNRDARTVQAICNLDAKALREDSACGIYPVATLMQLARLKGWTPRLLDYRNSGDTSGDRSRGVVGYASIAFYEETGGQTYSPAERKQLLALARTSLTSIVTDHKVFDPGRAEFPPKLGENKGCFVTLTTGGQLRGCIGHILPQEPLFRAIIDNAVSAAVRDQRFRPVQPEELDRIEIEVSVLTEPAPLAFTSPEDLLAKLQPHRDGLVLQMNGRGATFLPQVWEQIPDKEQFLAALAQKAGCAPDQWRQPGTTVAIYHVEAFKESELK